MKKRYSFLFLFILWGSQCLFAQTVINSISNLGDLSTESGDGGPAIAAGMNPTFSMCYDKKGNLYFTSQGRIIRKIDTFGIVSHVAGTGSAPAYSVIDGEGGLAAAASFNNILDIAVDPSDNLYLIERTFRTALIRKIDLSTGILTTIAGDTGLCSSATFGDGGPAAKACLWGIIDMDIDPAGNIYFTQNYGTTIRGVRKIEASGIITTLAKGLGAYVGPGGGDGGPANMARFETPTYIAVDAVGNIYVVDNSIRELRVRRINTRGMISTYAGGMPKGAPLGDGGPATAALVLPDVIEIDNAGNLYIADAGRIRKVDRSTGIIRTVAGVGYSGLTGDGGDPLLAKIWTGAHGLAFDACRTGFSFNQSTRIRRVSGFEKEDNQDVNDIDPESTSISDMTQMKLHIYPNPVMSELQILGIEYKLSVRIVDINGKSLLQKEVSVQNPTLNVADLPVGMYHLLLSDPYTGYLKAFNFIKQ